MASNQLAVADLINAATVRRESAKTVCAPVDAIRRSREVSRAALVALYQELCLYPKPGLVSKVDNGSHHDMTARLFVESLFSLRHYFAAIYLAGARNASFADLRQLGIDAEARMLRATGGVNTHRGAIFNLGLLSAAIGRREAEGTQTELSRIIVQSWSPAIKVADSRADNGSNGSRACREHAVGGARGEAAAGFPHVFKIGLPILAAARSSGATESAAAAQAFFAILASLDDTNVLHRGGPAGLVYAKGAANSFLYAGGVFSTGWQVRAQRIHRNFVQKRLSPGGSADLLAATLFVDRIARGIN